MYVLSIVFDPIQEQLVWVKRIVVLFVAFWCFWRGVGQDDACGGGVFWCPNSSYCVPSDRLAGALGCCSQGHVSPGAVGLGRGRASVNLRGPV